MAGYGLRNVFWTVMAIMAFQLITLCSIVIFQVASGNVTGGDLAQMLFVLRGEKRYVTNIQEYRRYDEFVKNEEEFRAKLQAERGSAETRQQVDTASAAERERIKQETDAAAALLAQEKDKLAQLRSEIEKAKKEAALAQAALDENREKAALKAQAERTEKYRKALAGLDAATVGKVLAGVLHQTDGGPIEVARIMQEHLKPSFISEVLEEMAEGDRQLIVPVLENEYAGYPPEKVAAEWKKNQVPPIEAVEYLKQMTVAKAFAVLNNLEPAEKRKMEQLLLNSSR